MTKVIVKRANQDFVELNQTFDKLNKKSVHSTRQNPVKMPLSVKASPFNSSYFLLSYCNYTHARTTGPLAPSFRSTKKRIKPIPPKTATSAPPDAARTPPSSTCSSVPSLDLLSYIHKYALTTKQDHQPAQSVPAPPRYFFFLVVARIAASMHASRINARPTASGSTALVPPTSLALSPIHWGYCRACLLKAPLLKRHPRNA